MGLIRMAEALYRKYRPKIFEDVVGQEHIERTIKNAIEQDKLSHAYLFTGPRGTGKTTTARLLAKALLCQKGPTSEPDGTCEDCEAIAVGEHPDVYELDAASRTGVENVREEIIGRVQFAPTRGRYKVYIIDEVHMLSTQAFNALLKTLEEPPSHVVFVLATTDPQMVPETIHSRCQRFDFRRISTESIVSRLGAICVAEGVEFEGEALELVAHRAEGGMRNALTSLEQLIAFGEGRVTMEVAERMLGSLDSSDLAEIVRFVGMRDAAACFRWTAEFVETGADLAQFTRDFAEHIRNLYVMSLAGADVALDVSEAARREMAEELSLYGPDRLARLLGVLGDLSGELKTSTNPRLSFEIALTRMIRPDSELTLEALAERVEALERGGAGAPAMAAATAAASAAPAVLPADVVERLDRLEEALSGVVVASSAASPVGLTAAASGGASAPSSRLAAAGSANLTASAAGASASAATAPASSAPAGEGFASQQAAFRAARPQHAQPADDPRVDGSSFGGAQERAEALREESRTAAVAVAAGGALPDQVLGNLRNAAALQRCWQQAMAQLKKAKAAYGVLFLNTKAVFEEASSSLAIDFPAENDFAFRAVQKPDVQDELARVIAQAFGCPLPFRLTKGGLAAGAALASVGASAASATSDASAAAPAASQAVQPRQIQSQPQQPSGLDERAQVGRQAAAQAFAEPRSGVFQSGGQQFSQPRPSASAHEVPASAGAPAPARPSASVSEPDPVPYDEVPLDAYDDVVPYDDEPYGVYEEPFPVPSRPSNQPSVQASASEPAQAVRPRVSSSEAAQGAALSVRSQDSAPETMQDAEAVGARPVPASAKPACDAASSATSLPDPAESGVEPTLSDLDAMLAFGFGEGVEFREV